MPTSSSDNLQFKQLLSNFKNLESKIKPQDSNIDDKSMKAKEENLRLAKEYIENISDRPSGATATNNSSFTDQALAIGLKVKVVTSQTR